jgi:hypothetical protein
MGGEEMGLRANLWIGHLEDFLRPRLEVRKPRRVFGEREKAGDAFRLYFMS